MQMSPTCMLLCRPHRVRHNHKLRLMPVCVIPARAGGLQAQHVRARKRGGRRGRAHERLQPDGLAAVRLQGSRQEGAGPAPAHEPPVLQPERGLLSRDLARAAEGLHGSVRSEACCYREGGVQGRGRVRVRESEGVGACQQNRSVEADMLLLVQQLMYLCCWFCCTI